MASSATRKLEGLRRKLAEAKQHEREIAAVPDALRDEVERLGEALLEHDLPADGSPPPAGTPARKAWDAWHQAKARLDGPWPARAEKARRETLARESEVGAFVVENLGALLAEVEPDAHAARDAVTSALADLAAAIDGWHEVEQRVATLLGPAPGTSGRDIAEAPFEPIRQQLRRLRAVEIPAPLPRSFYGDEPADAARQAHARAVEATVGDDL